MIWTPPTRSDELYHWGKKKSHKYVVKVGEGDDVRYFYSWDAYNVYKNGQKATLVTDPNEAKAHEKEAQERWEANQKDKKQQYIDQKRSEYEEKKKKDATDAAVLDKDPGKNFDPDKNFRDTMEDNIWPIERKKKAGEKIKDYLKDSLREYGAHERKKQKAKQEFAKEMGKEIKYQMEEAGKEWVKKESEKKSLLYETANFLHDLNEGKIKFDTSTPKSSKKTRSDKPKKSTKHRSQYN